MSTEDYLNESYPPQCAYRDKQMVQCTEYSAVDSSLCPTHRDLVFGPDYCAACGKELKKGENIMRDNMHNKTYCHLCAKIVIDQGLGGVRTMRKFETGATRDSDTEKYDYEGFLSPEVLERFGRYMHKHRKQADGQLRDSDNWQKGIPKNAYIKSLVRHVMDLWVRHRTGKWISDDDIQEVLCAILFNAQGYLFETIRQGQGDERNDRAVDNYSNRYVGGPYLTDIPSLGQQATGEVQGRGDRAVEPDSGRVGSAAGGGR